MASAERRAVKRRQPLYRIIGLATTLLVSAASPADAADPWPPVLAGTEPLRLEEPLDVVMVRGISQFAERELAATPDLRRATWNSRPNFINNEFLRRRDQQRERLRTIIGAVDERTDPALLILADESLSPAGEPNEPRVFTVRWDVLDGVTAEGLLLLPPGPATGYAVAVPDASWTPEMFCGVVEGVPAVSQFPRRLVRQGIVVLVPALISRDDTFSGHPDIRYTNIPHREFVYRMAFEMGRHIIGYEVQKVLAAVDVLQQKAEADGVERAVGVCGVGDGGQLALYTGAIDDQIGPTMISGYFTERESVWQEPIDRNIWDQLTSLGDAEIAALAAPGGVQIEASAAPTFAGPQPARAGRPDFAAPGTIETPPLESVRREFARLQRLADPVRARLFETDWGMGTAGSSNALRQFAVNLTGQDLTGTDAGEPLSPPEVLVDPQQRERRQLEELVRFTQRLLHQSDKERAKLWADADRSDPEAWFNSTLTYRQMVHNKLIGRLPTPKPPLNPRSRKVIDEPTHVGYEVVLDVISGAGDDASAGVIAGGILLLPKDLKDGEHRPVVVCQHGLEGTPTDTITTDETSRAWRAYKGFSTQLVERGFVVYAPQNPYRGEHHFRVIQRKSNPLGRSLFSYIIEQHRQTLRWLAEQPWVDAERIAFYGLSYGGKTAVRVPPLLSAGGDDTHPEYCLSICSADFNEWIRKNVSSEDRYSYVFTREYEMFEWNMGHVADYAELASLMVPRPFMVERGHDDGVAPDEWVAWEYAKVRRLYDKLGIGERTEIEFFNGPHTINGRGTFDFLHRHLNWPTKDPAVR